MKKNRRLRNRLIVVAVILSLVLVKIFFPAKANASDLRLANTAVTLDGVGSKTVEVELTSATGGTFYGLQADWTLSEKEDTNYFTLTGLTAGGEASPSENNPATGRIVWTDSSYTGFNVAAGGAVWKATYTVDKDTPEGVYNVGISISAITGGTAGYDSDEDFNLTAQITVNRSDRHIGNFVAGEGVTGIDVYYTQDYMENKSTAPNETNATKAYARNGANGSFDITGAGQINFKVNLESSYIINKNNITITYNGDKKYDSILESNDIYGESNSNYQDNMFRITGITGDITITINPTMQQQIVPVIEGVETNYEYTGSSIKPAITVKIYGTDTTLVEGTDYTVTYGTNTAVGTGTVQIHKVSTSQYRFDDSDATVNFNIVRRKIVENDVTVPASMTYTGSTLTPSVSVNTNGVVLTKDTDYTVSYENQDGQANENIKVTVDGIGNYTTENPIIKNVLITPKPARVIDSIDNQALTFGESKTYTNTADCEVTYTSSSNSIVSIEHTKSGNKSTNIVRAVGVGEAVITVTYAENDSYAETTTTFTITVNKAELTITNATVSNKTYDRSTAATVTAVEFNNSSNLLTSETDYTISAEFENADAGTNKTVTVTVTLVGDAANNYHLATNTYNTTATITKITIASENITIAPTSYEYDGTEREPAVTIEIGGLTLRANTDYALEYSNNINAGNAKVTITGKNNYKTISPIIKNFTITPKVVALSIEDIEDTIYNMEEQEPAVVVKVGQTVLAKGTDYNVSYSNNVNAGEGTAEATISEVTNGNYSFTTAKKTFTIKPYTILQGDVTLAYTTTRYNGNPKEPSVTVKLGEKNIPAANYSVQYANNTDVGEATVTVTATGSNYNTAADPVVKTFNIIDKEVLTISGIENNQSIVYTGNPVQLTGTLSVSENNNNITVSDLTTKWYSETGDEIEKPTNVGSYSVVYSYSDEDYTGNLTRNFEIVKAQSGTPEEATNEFTAIEGQTLANISLTTVGLSWVDASTPILAGRHSYAATYTKNNDTNNYTTKDISINVYGKKYIDITTSVSGEGGTISEPMNHVLEGTEKTIEFFPTEGYEVARATVNGTETAVSNNKLKITAGNEDVRVVAYYKVRQFKITITASNVEAIPSGVVSVNYNASQELTIRAKFGFKLKNIVVNGIDKTNALENDVLIISNIKEDYDVVATAEQITYDYTEGAEQTYNLDKNTTATFTIDATCSNFSKVYVDDKLVDPSNYEVKSGSTIIIFKQAFMDTLSIGNHTLKVAFNDGGQAITAFAVTDNETINRELEASQSKENESETNNENKTVSESQKTGDNIVKYVLVAMFSVIGIIAVKVHKKRSKRV